MSRLGNLKFVEGLIDCDLLGVTSAHIRVRRPQWVSQLLVLLSRELWRPSVTLLLEVAILKTEYCKQYFQFPMITSSCVLMLFAPPQNCCSRPIRNVHHRCRQQRSYIMGLCVQTYVTSAPVSPAFKAKCKLTPCGNLKKNDFGEVEPKAVKSSDLFNTGQSLLLAMACPTVAGVR